MTRRKQVKSKTREKAYNSLMLNNLSSVSRICMKNRRKYVIFYFFFYFLFFFRAINRSTRCVHCKAPDTLVLKASRYARKRSRLSRDPVSHPSARHVYTHAFTSCLVERASCHRRSPHDAAVVFHGRQSFATHVHIEVHGVLVTSK